MILHILIAMVAGWMQDHQQQVINYLREENRVLKAQLGGRRLRLTETDAAAWRRPRPSCAGTTASWPRNSTGAGIADRSGAPGWIAELL